MNEEWRSLGIILAISIPIGLLFGITLRKAWPAGCKAYARFCLNGKWWIFAFGMGMFLVLAIIMFFQGRRLFAIYFLLFFALETVCLIKYGFKHITPEQDTAIAAADPTHLRPLAFWKQNAEENSNPTPKEE